ncbi:MAG TPA: glycoside hydrolase family 3 C-terminal domain-containing protein [Opitutaceae bacterium]
MSLTVAKPPFKLHVLFLSLVAITAATLRADDVPLYRNPSQPIDARIHDLVSRMTVEEKASLTTNTTPGVPRLGIPKYDWWSEALHGVANAGHATVFPQAIGLAAMWDAPLQEEIAHVVGIEGRAKFNGYRGTNQEGTLFRGLTFWAPNINIFRDPRWGRGQETYGEDPFLTASLGVAFVRGLQGDDPNYLLAAACAKHYAVHSGPESLRHSLDVSPSDLDLNETYLPAFEALVREGHVEAVMTAYSSLYTIPCSIHPLLYGRLKEWNFNGHVTSDCGSVDDLSRSYHRATDNVDAEVLTTRAGMNLRCGGDSTPLVQAVKRGLISERELDQRVAPLLRTMFRLGFFDPADKVPFNKIAPSENEAPKHAELAVKAARESIVLLKNDGILPLDLKKFHHIAVIGPNASSVPALLGNYNGEPSAPITVLAGVRSEFESEGAKIDYAHGCDYSTRPDTWRPIPYPWYQAEFFSNATLSGAAVAHRTERPLCLACSAVPWSRLPAGVPDHGISVRWNGEINTTLAGEYQFRVRGRGGFRLFLNDKLVLDSWIPSPEEAAKEREVAVTQTLEDNAAVAIKLEYVQGNGPSSVVLEWKTPDATRQVDQALAAAQNSDLIVFVGGISAQLEGEEMNVDFDGFNGGDRQRIELPPLQQQLLEKLGATGKPIVFVNMSGSAVAFPWAKQHANAILQAWYPGQAGGTAVADVLLGKYNPSGRLPLTFYSATEDLPAFQDYNMKGRTYRYFDGAPLFPFGHGLSYTQFGYEDLHVKRNEDGTLTALVTITNRGTRDGDEVVQLYATPPADSHPREHEALCGFQRVHLKKGESRMLSIAVPVTALRRWDNVGHAYAIPHGNWTLRAAASSADIRQQADFIY